MDGAGWQCLLLGGFLLTELRHSREGVRGECKGSYFQIRTMFSVTKFCFNNRRTSVEYTKPVL